MNEDGAEGGDNNTGDSPAPDDFSSVDEADQLSDIEKVLRESSADQSDPKPNEPTGGTGPTTDPQTDNVPPTDETSTQSTDERRRLWNSFSNEESSDEPDQASEEKPSRTGQDDPPDWEQSEKRREDQEGPNRLWRRGSTSTEDGGNDTGPGKRRDTDGDSLDSPGRSSFDHLIRQSGDTRSGSSPSEKTEMRSFFADLEEFNRISGSQVLVVSPTEHSITDEVCSNFLVTGDGGRRNVMFVTTDDSPAERLQILRDATEWAGGNVAVIELGNTSGESTESVDEIGRNPVVQEYVTSPKNLSKAGLLITQTLNEWAGSNQSTIVCFHTLTSISGYVSNETLFRFLFLLKSKLNTQGVTGHYHINSSEHGEKDLETLKGMFDLVIRVSRDGDLKIE